MTGTNSKTLYGDAAIIYHHGEAVKQHLIPTTNDYQAVVGNRRRTLT